MMPQNFKVLADLQTKIRLKNGLNEGLEKDFHQ